MRNVIITPQTQTKTYPEKFVIGKLINNSRIFNNFYKKERVRIQIPIYWIESSTDRESDFYLPAGMVGGRYRNEYGETFIILKRIPAALIDEVLIAHEFGHLLLDVECHN